MVEVWYTEKKMIKTWKEREKEKQIGSSVFLSKPSVLVHTYKNISNFHIQIIFSHNNAIISNIHQLPIS